jgi:hypothetical protein
MVDNSKTSSYAAKLRREGVNCQRVPRGRNSRDALANASNYLRERAINGGYDFLLMLESDVFPPRDVIEQLLQYADVESSILQNGYRVIGAPYLIGDSQGNFKLCVFIPEKKENGTVGTRLFTDEEAREFLKKGVPRRIHGMGVGCTLIHRTVLERFPFHYSELDDDRMQHTDNRKHPDVYFYIDLQNNQIPVICVPQAFSLHRPSSWKLVKDV